MAFRRLSEEQAWKVIAGVFVARHGLCHAIAWLQGAKLISRETSEAMRQRFAKLPRRVDDFCWPHVPTGYDDKRLAFCEDQILKLQRKRKRKRGSESDDKPVSVCTRSAQERLQAHERATSDG